MHDGIRQAIVANDERATKIPFRSYRNTARVAANAVAVEAVRIERKGNPFDSIGRLVKGSRRRDGLVGADPEGGIRTAGMVQGPIHDVPSVSDLVRRIATEAQDLIAARLSGMTTTSGVA